MKKTDLPPDVLTQKPQISSNAFIAPGAQVVGDVRVQEGASIWYNSVARGDINYIAIGKNTNIQDGCILHVTNDLPCIVEDNVTVGHHVNLHACHIEEGSLIGIGAIILSGAKVKKGAIVGAGSIVLENTVVEENSLVVGVPAKPVRKLNENSHQENLLWAKKYTALSQVHQQQLQHNPQVLYTPKTNL